MAKQVCSRRELLDRWRGIEEDDEAAFLDNIKQREITRAKEEWFSDTFNYLICLPNDIHVWCGSWDLMGPLLETFFNYFKDKGEQSPLKILWKRISQEMRQCTQCICQHHQAQEMYNSEYESSSVGPLLTVLRSLDEERVTHHFKEINERLARGEHDPEIHNVEVVSVMFEVLMFPILLDDQSLVNEFLIFIEAIDNSHELTLAGHQQYPGVYALLFLKSRRARSIGHRLAGYVGKLRRSEDLEPLQPLLKKYIGYLETEILPSTLETSRPRVQLERITVWLGIKALLGFLEPSAFEEGILERYPIFLSIVLNHVSDDSLEFSHAVNCLRLLFEMLGCKLWLRTTLSPSVMRNTLLGQCFHTRNEKSHKEIFDLFQPFLQSLEALEDGEHEKQRRHFLYFLLHQVNMSSNFGVLMRKKACQVALLIIHRGYKMNPPCPPFECAHMWGPSLIRSLKDSSLHSSLRQPAFDLIQNIIVADSTALTFSLLSSHMHHHIDGEISADSNDYEDELPFSHDVEEKDTSCWSEFDVQSKLISQEFRGWMCIPMLWFDVLVDTNPSVIPISFSKAVLWALSRISMVEPENSLEMGSSVSDWLLSNAGDISFVWEVPTGSDDGEDGKLSKNSIKISTMSLPLLKIFRRFSAHFITQMEHGQLWKQWTWEPRMAESLILLLLDPNDNVRQVDRLILEHVSNTRGLASGLQFLCSSGSSLSAILLGLRHAVKLVQLDSVLLNFHSLHHFFFVLRKLLKEAVESPQHASVNPVDTPNISSFSSQGGFLRQPFDNASVMNVVDQPNVVDMRSWERFSCLLSELLWPCLSRCLAEAKKFINIKNSQMTCIRLLEILPVVIERLSSSFLKLHGAKVNLFNLEWLHDLADWEKSPLPVVTRYWRQSFMASLDLLKGLCQHNSESASIIRAIKTLFECDGVAIDKLNDQISLLSVSLSSKVVHSPGISSAKLKPSCFEALSLDGKCSALDRELSLFGDVEVQTVPTSAMSKKKHADGIVVLSDDDMDEKKKLPDVDVLHHKNASCAAENSILEDDHARKPMFFKSRSKNLSEAFQFRDIAASTGISSQKHEFDILRGDIAEKKGVYDMAKVKTDALVVRDAAKHTHKNISSDNMCPKSIVQESSTGRAGACADIQRRNSVRNELTRNDENDTWEAALRSARRPQLLQTKTGVSVPKRQVIQLKMPGDSKSGHLRRLDTGIKRLKPPRLDDWYRPILEIDYFSTVGLSSANKDENGTTTKFKEVPLYFQSPEHYVEIFRPLVLEELKAQLYTSFMESSSPEEMCCRNISVLSVERVDDFHLIRCIPAESESAASRGCSENDLVLLTRQPLQNSTHDFHMVGKVERCEKDNKSRSNILVIRFYLQNGCSRLNKAKRFLTERSKWYLSRIMSITPQIREFQALSSLNDIPMLPIILRPADCSLSNNGSRSIYLGKLPQPLKRVLKSSFNDSQLQAISVAIETHEKNNFDLSLIQGPPGTGKTRTILAIVSGLLAFLSQQRNLNSSSRPSANPRSQICQSAAVARAWQDAALAKQLNEEGEKDTKRMENFKKGRVLICAQSNAAVDELVSRISNEGLYGIDGAKYKPYLVRVGNAKTVHPCSLPFFIDTLVDQRLAEGKMNENKDNNSLGGEPSSITLRSNLEKLVDQIRSYEVRRASINDKISDQKSLSSGMVPKEDDVQEVSDAALGAKLKRLYEQKKQICINLAAAQAREKKASDESKALKHKLRKVILKEAEIVVTTLSGCGGDLYSVCSESMSNSKFGNSLENTLFDAVLIDEAAQALEPATLIPLQLLKSRGTRCIMVGDPKQLPATVLSQVASKFLYECSMFERLQRAGHPVTMLAKQYRMHPEICRFPSLHFYDNRLLNGEQTNRKSAPFHENKYLGPYVFFDVVDGQECSRKNSGSLSLYNEHEAEAAVEVLRFFKKRYPSEFFGGRIGIISPYKSQVALLRSRFSGAFGPSATSDMEFNTVDGFQGREVDILILSTVRASAPSSTVPGSNSSIIGFVADVRRMNVALTRAKLCLWILGNASTLRTNQNWAALVENAKERRLIFSLAQPYDSIFRKPSSDSKHKQNLVGSSITKDIQDYEVVKGTASARNPDLSRSSANEADDMKRKNVENNIDERHSRRLKSDKQKNMSAKMDFSCSVVEKNDNREPGHVKPSIASRHGMPDNQDEKMIDGKRVERDDSTLNSCKKKGRSENSGKHAKLSYSQEERCVSDFTSYEGAIGCSKSDIGQSTGEYLRSHAKESYQKKEVDKRRRSGMLDTCSDLAVTSGCDTVKAPTVGKKPERTLKHGSAKRPVSPSVTARDASRLPKKAP